MSDSGLRAKLREGEVVARQRWFCAVCGALTINPEQPDGRAYCRAHSDLPALDEPPADPLESLPVTAATIHGEALHPADGTEA